MLTINWVYDPEVRASLRSANPNKVIEHSRDLRAEPVSWKNDLI